MDFGDIISILGDIVEIVVRVLSNKDKKRSNVQTNANPTRTAESSINKLDSYSSQKSGFQKTSSNKSRKTAFSGSLEDLFKELKTEFEKNFGDMGKEQTYSAFNENKDIEDGKTDDKSDQYESIEISESIKRKNSILDSNTIYDGEIGREKTALEFNRNSIIQGVIMSEILQKPKSLRR